MKLIHNAIIKAKFYRAGDEIPNEIVPVQLRQYKAKEVKEPTEPKEINLMYKHNQAYSVDAGGIFVVTGSAADGRDAGRSRGERCHRRGTRRLPLDETTAAALEQARDDYQADVSRQVAQARYAAKHAEQAEEAVREGKMPMWATASLTNTRFHHLSRSVRVHHPNLLSSDTDGLFWRPRSS